MTDHQAIEELLAGYALRSLSGVDAAEAEVLLAEHVPGCLPCRDLLHGFGELAADLALVVDPIEPPDTLLPRLHREMEPRARGVGRWTGRSAGRVVAAAAGIVVVIGLGGLALRDGTDASLRQGTPADLRTALDLAQGGEAQAIEMGPATEVVVPGDDEFYVVGEDVPAPPTGMVYRLWLLSGEEAAYVGQFTPAPDGMVVLLVAADPASFDRVLITVEPASSEPQDPGEPAWDGAA